MTFSFKDSCEFAVLHLPKSRGYDQTDRVLGITAITSGLRLGRFEVLRSLRHGPLAGRLTATPTAWRIEAWNKNAGRLTATPIARRREAWNKNAAVKRAASI